MVAPEEIVVALLGIRSFERGYSASLRVDTTENVLDRAILPARIHSLQHDKKPLLILGV